MPLACVDTLFSPVEAAIVRSRLEAAGIACVLFDEAIASLIGPGVSGIRIMVDEDDLALARTELARPL
jgi:hypothetical protein